VFGENVVSAFAAGSHCGRRVCRLWAKGILGTMGAEFDLFAGTCGALGLDYAEGITETTERRRR
jgi:hypothetical protein